MAEYEFSGLGRKSGSAYALVDLVSLAPLKINIDFFFHFEAKVKMQTVLYYTSLNTSTFLDFILALRMQEGLNSCIVLSAGYFLCIKMCTIFCIVLLVL